MSRKKVEYISCILYPILKISQPMPLLVVSKETHTRLKIAAVKSGETLFDLTERMLAEQRTKLKAGSKMPKGKKL